MMAKYIFWICVLLVAHTYVFYPVILFFAYAVSQVRRDWWYLTQRRNRRTLPLEFQQTPLVTLIVPLYNEEASLPKKLFNLQQIDYPAEKFDVVLVSDGSTDRTNEILRNLSAPRIKTIILPARKGKSNALNVAAAEPRNEILIFSDASTIFDPSAVKNLVRHFSDPHVGAVCGALDFERTPESERTEGVYWKYESMLRLMEARLGATLTASGAIYALRRDCYRALAPNTIIEDFVIPMNARRAGYRVLYDPEARGTEVAASSVAGEFTRRVRLAVGSYRALAESIGTGFDSFSGFAFFSHKLLRWVLPFVLIALLIVNALLLSSPFYRAAFMGQLFFYLWACMGFIFRHRIHRVRYVLMGYFLLAMNVAFLVGFYRFLVDREDTTWQRVN